MLCLHSSAGHVWDQWRGVSQSALCAEQRGCGQRSQYDPVRRRGVPTAGQCQRAVGHPEGPAGCLADQQEASHLHLPHWSTSPTRTRQLQLPHIQTTAPFVESQEYVREFVPVRFSCRSQSWKSAALVALMWNKASLLECMCWVLCSEKLVSGRNSTLFEKVCWAAANDAEDLKRKVRIKDTLWNQLGSLYLDNECPLWNYYILLNTKGELMN